MSVITVTGQLEEVITVLREVTITVTLDESRDVIEQIEDAIRTAAYEPLAVPAGSPWELTGSEGANITFSMDCANGCGRKITGTEDGIDCTECGRWFCDSCYDTCLGDGCHCHEVTP